MDSLPRELIELITENLNLKSLIAFGLTSKRYNKICLDIKILTLYRGNSRHTVSYYIVDSNNRIKLITKIIEDCVDCGSNNLDYCNRSFIS